MNDRVREVLGLLEQCTELQRKAVFSELRKSIPIHPIESTLQTSAEIILHAISKDEKGLTFRMLRGVIAEAAFELEVVFKSSNLDRLTGPRR